MENGKQPINPCTVKGQQTYTDLPLTHDVQMIGLTKREYFAALAMQGLLACPDISASREDIAEESVKQADELLKVLEKYNQE